MSNIRTLAPAELNAVAGGIGISPLPAVTEVRAQDMYGNTMSAEDYMNWTAREHDPANGDSIHDFPGGRGQ